MILLDENINEDQRELLAAWNIRVKQIGVEVETKGVTDERIISVLHDFKNCLFLSSDNDFWDRKYCHGNYCWSIWMWKEMKRHSSSENS